MADEKSSELIDFDFNSDEVEIGYPKIAGGTYPFKIEKTFVTDAKSGEINPATGAVNKNLVVEFSNHTQLTALQKDPSKPARVLEPGQFKLSVYCPMQDSGAMKKGQWMERITEIHRACGLSGKPSTGNWQNKVVAAKVVLDPERKDEKSGKTYDEGNSIKSVLPFAG